MNEKKAEGLIGISVFPSIPPLEELEEILNAHPEAEPVQLQIVSTTRTGIIRDPVQKML